MSGETLAPRKKDFPCHFHFLSWKLASSTTGLQAQIIYMPSICVHVKETKPHHAPWYFNSHTFQRKETESCSLIIDDL